MKKNAEIFYIPKILFSIALYIFLMLFVSLYASASSSDDWAWPTEKQTISNDWPRYSSGKYHSGTDFSVPKDTPVYSTCDGKVVSVKTLTKSYGKHIKIEAIVNGDTVYIRYCHLNSFAVSEGDIVKCGQLIGYSGSTGNSTGPHLHYEVRNENDYYGNVNSPTLDPRNYLPGSSYSFTLNEENKENVTEKDNVSRDIVLVLDRSGSMDGEPLDQTKEAAVKFVDTVFEREARVSVVAYDTWASEVSPLSDDQQMLEEDIRELYADGTTNMYDGLVQADNILQDSQANRKIIVLMSDGLPNEGENDFGDFHSPLLQYAEELKNKGYYVYTLGFFTDLDSYDLYGAQQLLEGIASPGLHYEVNDPNDLVFFFDDIANQISGTRFVYIRIACPVDVTVSSDGETLSSKAESENGRTSFGTLTYETVQDESQDQGGDIFGGSLYGELGGSLYGEEEPTVQDQAKILRLNMDQDYDVEIEGYDKGTMDYSVSFPNENGEYDDVREFPGIDVTASMKATSNTGESKATYLKVDENGDGKIDTTYKTEANGTMEEVKDSKVLYIVLIAAGILILVLILVIVLVCVSRSKKKKRQDVQPAGYIFGAFGLYQNKMYPMSPGQQCVVGRKTSCDIQLVHSQVSRMHCVIEMLPDGVYQVTNYSSNGTFYNDQKLKYGEPYRLPKGALLAIGDADNVLELR